MKIIGYSDAKYRTPIKANPYVVMINPESIDSKHINDAEEPVNSGQKPSSGITIDQFSFNLVIDCTGIVNAKRTNMATEIEALEKVLYKAKRKNHEPNFVKISWGKHLNFEGQITAFDVHYTLFRSDGSPLRAKLALTFEGQG